MGERGGRWEVRSRSRINQRTKGEEGRTLYCAVLRSSARRGRLGKQESKGEGKSQPAEEMAPRLSGLSICAANAARRKGQYERERGYLVVKRIAERWKGRRVRETKEGKKSEETWRKRTEGTPFSPALY